jgi:sirohydrochlorin ferrochelatase
VIEMARILLIDNGSLRAEAYQNLDWHAKALTGRLAVHVMPAPLMHSDKIPASDLDGECAQLWDQAATEAILAGETRFYILPFFLGPTRAITEYLPAKIHTFKEHFPEVTFECLPFLATGVADADIELLDILEAYVRERIDALHWEQPAVVLVDHGSPVKAVAELRNRVAHNLQDRLANSVKCVLPASMERRPEPEYAFNEPLLERAFEAYGLMSQPVIVAQFFLSPGRHAGRNGDVVRICKTLMEKHPDVQVETTPPISYHPRFLDLLERRWREWVSTASCGEQAL